MQLTQQQKDVMAELAAGGLTNPVPAKTNPIKAKIDLAVSMVNDYTAAALAEKNYYLSYHNLNDEDGNNDVPEPNPLVYPGTFPAELDEIVDAVANVIGRLEAIKPPLDTIKNHVDDQMSKLKTEQEAVTTGIRVYDEMGNATGNEYSDCYGSLEGLNTDAHFAAVDAKLDAFMAELFYETWTDPDWYEGRVNDFVYDIDIVQAGQIDAASQVFGPEIDALNAVPGSENSKKTSMISQIEKFVEANKVMNMANDDSTKASLVALASPSLKSKLGI